MRKKREDNNKQFREILEKINTFQKSPFDEKVFIFLK
jgi:hypothetical protein